VGSRWNVSVPTNGAAGNGRAPAFGKEKGTTARTPAFLPMCGEDAGVVTFSQPTEFSVRVWRRRSKHSEEPCLPFIKTPHYRLGRG